MRARGCVVAAQALTSVVLDVGPSMHRAIPCAQRSLENLLTSRVRAFSACRGATSVPLGNAENRKSWHKRLDASR